MMIELSAMFLTPSCEKSSKHAWSVGCSPVSAWTQLNSTGSLPAPAIRG